MTTVGENNYSIAKVHLIKDDEGSLHPALAFTQKIVTSPLVTSPLPYERNTTIRNEIRPQWHDIMVSKHYKLEDNSQIARGLKFSRV